MRVDARGLIIKDGAVLLVQFDDETGLHYNLPGGGIQPGESIQQALAREVKEEASAAVQIGALLWAIEYEPERNAGWAGSVHKLSLIFDCRLREGERPGLPTRPDANQTGVEWVSLRDLDEIELLPHLTDRIHSFVGSRATGDVFLQEPLNWQRAARYLDSSLERKAP